jgi:hypothetical protein
MKYTLILDGKKEFYPKLNNKKYNILLVDNKEKIKFMIKFFENFIIEQNKNKKINYYLGMDFEYNRVQKTQRDIALFQINLESDNNNIGTIFVFYPPELSKNDTNILIKLITNDYMIKILHGGESLDIPYLFDQLLITKENIHNFCKNLYDTKYLCEYTHIENNVIKKCSIYYLLEEYKILTHKKLVKLESIESLTGPIWLIDIDIHNIDFNIFRYALYDVLFLPDLIKKFLNKSYIYTDLIPEISHIVFQYKRHIASKGFSFENIIEDVNKYNNFFIIINNEKIKLNYIYDYYLLVLCYKTWDNLFKITYFKKFFETLLKYIIYSSINYTIYKENNIQVKKLPIINFNQYNELNKLINNIKKKIV